MTTRLGSDDETDVERSINTLGTSILNHWRMLDFASSAFTSIAAEALDAASVHTKLDVFSLARWIISHDALPYQQYFGTHFGEPPVTLFWNSAFYIEALHWNSATPAIHNHAFRGAFAVLHGSSLQTSYTFQTHSALADTLKIGRLSVTKTEILETGAVREIHPREELIHAVFHLDCPSVTLVVRTHSESNRDGRFEYLPPSVAVDGTQENQARTRRLQVLAFLAQVDRDRFIERALEVIARQDLVTVFMLLRQTTLLPQPASVLNPILQAAKLRFGGHWEHVYASLEEGSRQLEAVRWRRQVTDAKSRLFVGLLLGQQDWPAIRAELARMNPGESPEDVAIQVVSRLGDKGLLPFRLDDEGRTILLRLLTKGLPKGSQTPSGDSCDDLASRWQRTFTQTRVLRPLFIGHRARSGFVHWRS